MATLADVLRQTGYAQNGTLATPTPTDSPMTNVLSEHIKGLPQKFNENQANQMALLGQAFPGNTYESMMTQGDPKALAELAMQVPLVGMTKATLPRKETITNEIEKLVEDYKGSHIAPNAKKYGGTLDALHQIMPADVYSQQGKRLYGIGDSAIDHEWYMAAIKSKGKPENLVEVYRAVPKGIKDINHGDWVTTSKTYAKNHGERSLNDEYDILSKKVKASTLSSEGYPYEFGYHE